MKDGATRLAILLGVLAGGVVATSYSWTFTPLGRLDYGAALLSKMVAPRDDVSPDLTPEARAEANEFTRWLIADFPQADGVRFEDRAVPREAGGGHVPVRIYTPDEPGPLPFYLEIHGGGWWMGNGFLFHDAMMDFAQRAGAIVVSVDYRLAPEHPYPAALEDCEAVLRFIAREGTSLGGDPERIAIGGSSAGGNLAAALALKMRDEGGPAIAFQYLQVPATDLSGTRQWHSYDEAGERYFLSVASLGPTFEAYVPDPRERMSPYVSPLLAGDLAGLPPALVVTALFDPLRDQGEAYARRLEAAGVRVHLHREEGAIHGFLGSPARARRIQEMAAEEVRRALARPGAGRSADRDRGSNRRGLGGDATRVVSE